MPIYVNSIAGILRRMLESLGLAYDPADFDTTAWAFAEADLPGIVGFRQGATGTTTLSAAEEILAGSGAILAAGRAGKLRLADPLATDAPQFDLPSACVLACEPLPLPASLRPLPRAIAVRWGRNHAPLSNMAGSVAAADRQLWRLLRGTAYGIREGRVMLDRRDRNPYTGAEFPVPAIVNQRMATFTLPALSVAEARNQHRDMLRRLGAARDTLWIAELSDSLAERNRRAIWGAMNAPGEEASVSRESFPLAARAVRMVERV